MLSSHAAYVGAACEDGYYCDTGRADATGGYCQPVDGVATAQAFGLSPSGGPAEAPAGTPTGAPSEAPSTPIVTTVASNQACTSSGTQLFFVTVKNAVQTCNRECLMTSVKLPYGINACFTGSACPDA